MTKDQLAAIRTRAEAASDDEQLGDSKEYRVGPKTATLYDNAQVDILALLDALAEAETELELLRAQTRDG